MVFKGSCLGAGVLTGAYRSGVRKKISHGVEPLTEAVENYRCVEHGTAPGYTPLLRPEELDVRTEGENNKRGSGLYSVGYILMVRHFMILYDPLSCLHPAAH